MVEIIPKPTVKIPRWQKFLPYFSIALMIVAILGYFVLNNILEKTLQTIEEKEDALAKLKTPEEQNLEKEILNYQKKIKDFSILIDQHLFPSNFFSLFEGLSHPKVWFSSIELQPKEARVSLSGQAENFSVLGQQLLIFKKEKRINDLKLTKVSLAEKGGIKFDLDIFLSPEIFKF
jgi:hypothetical protein